MPLPSVVQTANEKADQMMKDLASGAIVDVVDDPTRKSDDATPPVIPPQEEQAPNAEYDALKHKHSVLEGKYNAETADFRRQLVMANETIDRQNRTILDLHDRVKALGGGAGAGERRDEISTPEKHEQTGTLKKINPDQFDGYGSEMRDLVDGFNALIEENARLQGTVDQAKKGDEDRAWNSFTSTLAGLVPDWEALNYDKDFLAHLAGFDLETDVMTRQQKLNHFVSQGDAQKAAKIFNGYKASKGGAKHAAPGRPSKEDVIVPDQSAGGGGAPINNGGPAKDVTVDDLNKARNDYIQKRISYEEFEKVSNAYQHTLARQSQARK